MTKQEMIETARAEAENYEIIGYRYIPAKDWTPGAILEPSRVWVRDEDGECHPTDEALDGVCCFRAIDKVIAYTQYSNGYIVLVGGDRLPVRDDSDVAGELLISNPTVLGYMVI